MSYPARAEGLLNRMTSSDILNILRQSYPAFLRPYPLLFVVNPRHSNIFSVSFWSLWRCVDQCIEDLQLLSFPCSILTLLRRTVRSLLAKRKLRLYFPHHRYARYWSVSTSLFILHLFDSWIFCRRFLNVFKVLFCLYYLILSLFSSFSFLIVEYFVVLF